MRRGLLIVLGVLVLLGVGVFAWISSSKDESTTVSSKDAVRIAGAGKAAKKERSTAAPGLRPVPGTYTYLGSGTESLSLLGGSKHTFPDQIFAVVGLSDDDKCAWTMDLVFIEEHTEERTFCTTSNGVLDTGFSRTTEFARYKQTSRYTCDEATALRLKTGAKKAETWTWQCTERRGGKVRYTATNMGDEKLVIKGSPTPVTHVQIKTTQDDRSKGTETSNWWLMPSGLPVKMQSKRELTTSAGPLGQLDSTEQFSYTLQSTVPKAA